MTPTDHPRPRTARQWLRWNWPIVAFMISFLATAFAVYGVFQVTEDTQQLAAENASLIASVNSQQQRINANQRKIAELSNANDKRICETTNKGRAGLRKLINSQIQSVQDTDPTLFPDIPPDKFAELTQQRVDELQGLIDIFQPLPCDERFDNIPPPVSH